MTFQQFVNHYGIENLAKTLKVHVTTIYAWHGKKRRPGTDYIAALITLSKKKLTFESIMNSTIPAKKIV